MERDNEVYSSAEQEQMAYRRETDTKYDMMPSSVEEEQYRRLSSKRELRQTCFQRFDWSWRVSISTALTITMILVYLIGGNVHYNTIREVNSIFKTTGEIQQTIVDYGTFQRFFKLANAFYIAITS